MVSSKLHQCGALRANTYYTLAPTYYQLAKRLSSLHSLEVV